MNTLHSHDATIDSDELADNVIGIAIPTTLVPPPTFVHVSELFFVKPEYAVKVLTPRVGIEDEFLQFFTDDERADFLASISPIGEIWRVPV